MIVWPVQRPDGLYYQVAVVSKQNVTAFKPEVPSPPLIKADATFRSWLLTKLVNAQVAARKSGLHLMFTRPRASLLAALIQRHVEPKELKRLLKEDKKK